MQLAHCVAAQVAPLCRVRRLTLHCKLKTASLYSKGRANGSRPRAANQASWIVVTWTPLVDDRADGSMQHQEQQQQLALATSTSVLADTNVLCVASKADQSTRGLAYCTSLARCATTAQLCNRWPRVRTMRPDSTPVIRRPFSYREQSAGDRRSHGSAYNCYTTVRVTSEVVGAKGPPRLYPGTRDLKR